MNYADLIGTPFELGGRSSAALDCYGLVLEMARRDGRELPDYTSPKENSKIAEVIQMNLETWTPCDLKRGCLLIFKVIGSLHCGVYLGEDKFIHSWEASGGVCVERLNQWKRRLAGCYERT